jgi:hypothetical protein
MATGKTRMYLHSLSDWNSKYPSVHATGGSTRLNRAAPANGLNA